MLSGAATAAFAEIAVLGFVVVGTLNAVVNTRAVARYLGGNIVLSNLLVRPPPTGLHPIYRTSAIDLQQKNRKRSGIPYPATTA
jgi:hypothetical protein